MKCQHVPELGFVFKTCRFGHGAMKQHVCKLCRKVFCDECQKLAAQSKEAVSV